MAFDEEIQQVWQDRIDSRHLFRGMSLKDIVDPLDPSRDPFEAIRPRLFLLLDVLQGLLDAGLKFRLREEHFGDVCWHELQNIVTWTRRDLEDTGIDFTSRREVAKGYSDCYQGSQLKQNFRYITEQLPRRRADPVVRSLMTEEKWQLLSVVSEWVSTCSPEHRRAVVSVRRSCPLLVSDGRLLPVGSLECFMRSVEQALADRGLDKRADNVRRLLPDEECGFDFRLRVPMPLKCIEKIEEIAEPDAVQGEEDKGGMSAKSLRSH